MSDRTTANTRPTQPYYLAFAAALVIFVVLRAFAWHQTALLEDHDSTGLLRWTQTVLTFDIRAIVSLDPDASLFFPFFAALFSLPGWSLETAARLVSFASSVLLFVALIGIGWQMGASAVAILFGLILLAFNPELVPLSIAVLTEPSYVATVYLGFLLFCSQYKVPTLPGAALLGVVFGLAFLNRLEGILFLGFVPFMLGVYYFWRKPKNYTARRAAAWAAVFVMTFSTIAGLQIARVSHEMGSPAVNGRQAWTLLLHTDGVGDSYQERIYGLSFDPGQVNIMHAKGNFRALSTRVVDEGLLDVAKSYIRTLILNLDDLYSNRATALLGHLVIIFFAFGLLQLYQTGRRFEVTLIGAFIACGLLAPLLHNVAIRHIIVIAPIMLLVAGIGIESLSRSLSGSASQRRLGSAAVAWVLVLATVAAWAYPLRAALRPPEVSREYSVMELREPIRTISQMTAETGVTPRLIARRAYLAYFADAEHIRMPYASYDELVRYISLNDASLLYLTDEARAYPFAAAFDAGAYHEDFELIYEGVDAQGGSVELYRFLGPPVSTMRSR
jgi:hypothetical protein